MGALYLAEQIEIERQIVLKVLLPELAENPSFETRFRREAQLLKSLVHPNTVRVYDFGETEDGIIYISMEYLEGRTLRDELDTHGSLSVKRAVKITRQILKSLAEAHEHNTIHRDLKPENIMLVDYTTDKDFVKVIDFGIAKPTGDQEMTKLTRTGTAFGTPNYMAPEQILGKNIGPHTDVYPVGLLLIEMISGQMAISGTKLLEVAQKQVSPEPVVLQPLVAQTPLGPVIKTAVEKNIANRFQNCVDFIGALDGVEENAYTSKTFSIDVALTAPKIIDEPAGGEIHSTPGSSRMVQVLVIFLVISVLILIAGVFYKYNKNDRQVDKSGNGNVTDSNGGDQKLILSEKSGEITGNIILEMNGRVDRLLLWEIVQIKTDHVEKNKKKRKKRKKSKKHNLPQNVEDLNVKAKELLKKGELDKARKILKKSLEVNERDHWAWAMLGNISYSKKEYLSAIEYHSKAIFISPKADYYIQLGRDHYRSGLYGEAKKIWEKGLTHTKNKSKIKLLEQLIISADKVMGLESKK